MPDETPKAIPVDLQYHFAVIELAKWVLSAAAQGLPFSEGTVDLAQKVIHDALK